MLNCRRHGRLGRRLSTQRGLSVVELMVGVTLGLFVVAAAALMVSSQLTENRKLLLETQLQQDMRSSMDIITRELRRASYTPGAPGQLWYEGRTNPISQSSYGALTPESGSTLSEVGFSYRRRSGDEGPYGFKLESNALKSKIGGEWQILTDAAVMRVTAFTINLSTPVSYQLPCPRLCTGGTMICWPELQMRTATITLSGQSTNDVSVQRTLRTQVRLRNDWAHFNAAEICPA